MTPDPQRPCIAFVGTERIARGTRLDVAMKLKKYLERNPDCSPLVFDEESSAAVEFDLRGTLEELRVRLQQEIAAPDEKTGPGRPKLVVVSREIGLLPRHWEWLALQPGGASVALRKLVEEARRQNSRQDQVRQSQNAAYKFMVVMAGNLAHFEEAMRAFFDRNKALFETLSAAWPKDIKEHAYRLAAATFAVTLNSEGDSTRRS